ncbi:MAG: LPXTG-motif cell wall anchor protein [Amycolatopsis sp.]|jgi:hypothetical protein|uniref:DUF4397 domain-containing protein n=1 Tax=Amycolatopsis sp. TaxID=37632 RepID=UPI00261C8B4D|nr:DUF4397 domain-containing protein [Amycolatopsis sp.]MCU1686510.1 LPXTG-motif cell wall anchor protein [Amycolatopsis sp.]
MIPRRQNLRRLTVALAVAALLCGFTTGAAAAAPGAGVGWIRIGHLSPKTPPVDIYFAPFGQAEKVVIRKAGYGAVTGYSSLDPGKYTLSMRPADADAASPPALTATISVVGATAYSLLVFANGPDGTLQGDMVTDDLTPPTAGNGRVRVVQGSAAVSPVTVTGPKGLTIIKDAMYGVATPYIDVPEGRWPLQLTSGAVSSPTSVDVRAGSVNTVLVTQKPGGGLQSESIADGATLPDAPKLGVETGGGGTAPQQPGPAPMDWLDWAVVFAVVVAGSGTFCVVARRRFARAR